MRLSKKLVIAALGSATLVLNPLAALAAGPTIEDTDGPLVRIAISDTLNCSINYQGDRYNEFYNGRSPHQSPADCGTFLAVGSELFGPGVLNSRTAKSMGTIAWTPDFVCETGVQAIVPIFLAAGECSSFGPKSSDPTARKVPQSAGD